MHKTQHDLVYRKLLATLKSLRLSSGQSQSDVSEKLGMYSTFMTKVEIGERRLDVLELIQLCHHYKVRLADVLDQEEANLEGDGGELIQPVVGSPLQVNAQGEKTGQPEKILIVEDDELSRNELQRILIKEGFQVITALDGKEGLEKFESDRPDIIITDLKMAHLDGLQLLRAVKEKSRHTEVIVVTGHGASEESLAALRSGVTCFLKKPINLDELLLAISRAEDRKIQRSRQSAKPTVLIIDDEEDITHFLAQAMEREGWNVLTASDGERGMALFNGAWVDVVLTDLKMPKKDGFTVLKEIKEDLHKCEVIMMSGHGNASTPIQSAQERAFLYIPKPFDLDYAVAAVLKAYEKLQHERAHHYVTKERETIEKAVLALSDEGLALYLSKLVSEKALGHVRKMFDTSPVDFLVLDRDLKVLCCSPLIVQSLGYYPKVFDVKLLNRISDSVAHPERAHQKMIADLYHLFPKKGELKSIALGKENRMIATSVARQASKNKSTEVLSILLRGPAVSGVS